MIDPPSVQAVKSFLRSEPRSVEKIVETFAMRTALLAVGFAIFDKRDTALKNAVLASATIEAYLLYFYSKYSSDV